MLKRICGRTEARKLAPMGVITPVIFVTPNDDLLEKLKSKMQKLTTWGGELCDFADGDSEIPEHEGIHILRLPEQYGLLSTILHVIQM